RAGHRRGPQHERLRREPDRLLARALPGGGRSMTARWLLPLVVVFVLASLLLGAPVVHGQELPAEPAPPAPPPPEGHLPPEGPGGPPGLLPGPKQWAADVFNQVLVALLRGLSDALRGVVNGVLHSALNFITPTPPAGSYASPTVHTLWD